MARTIILRIIPNIREVCSKSDLDLLYLVSLMLRERALAPCSSCNNLGLHAVAAAIKIMDNSPRQRPLR